MSLKDTDVVRSITLKNGLQLTLRHAQPADAERLLAYLEQIAGESENITFGPGEFGMSVEEEHAALQKAMQSPTSLYLLAEIDGELAGMLSFDGGKRPRTRHAGAFGITVLRKYWGLGIGNHLLSSLVTWAQQTGVIRKINLHVRTDNLSAIHLYEKHGFVHEGRITRELYLNGQFIDVYQMGLLLDPPEVL